MLDFLFLLLRGARNPTGQVIERARRALRIGGDTVVPAEGLSPPAELLPQARDVDRALLGQVIGKNDEGLLEGGQAAGNRVVHRFDFSDACADHFSPFRAAAADGGRRP
jgi:hypothetical protein